MKLRQCFYKDDQILDKDCVPYSATGLNLKALESQHIYDLISKGDHKDTDYWGFTSWRLLQKTGLTYQDIKKEIDEDNSKHDVYLYYHTGEDHNLLHNKVHPIGRIVSRLYKIGAIPFENKDLQWVNIFCNYWIARPDIIDQYVKEFLGPVLEAFKTDPYIKAVEEEEKFTHRGELVSVTPFVCEYLFGLFLFHHKEINYKRICINDMTMPNGQVQDELQLIYDKYKEAQHFSGGGDKGTIHHYIPSYSRMFRDIRKEKLNILEIGVWKGESLKMWREYFPNSDITGVDITLEKVPGGKIEGVNLHVCDATDKNAITKLLKDKKFDIIIDDGSHKTQHIIMSWHYLWDLLNEGGLYIAEDIQEPDIDIPTIELATKRCTKIVDTRKHSGRYDDILMIWKK